MPGSVTASSNVRAEAGCDGGAIIWTVNQGYLAWAAAGSRNPLLVAAYDAIVP